MLLIIYLYVLLFICFNILYQLYSPGTLHGSPIISIVIIDETDSKVVLSVIVRISEMKDFSVISSGKGSSKITDISFPEDISVLK